MPVDDLNEKLYLPGPRTTVRPIFQAAVGHVPILKDYVTWHLARENAQRDDDLQEFCERVALGMNDMCKRLDDAERSQPIDGVHMWSHDFFRVFSSAAREYVADAESLKREYLIAFVVNYSKNKRPDITLAQIFWSLVRELSGTHILVLAMLHGAQKALTCEDLQSLRPERKEAVSLHRLASATSVGRALLEIITQTLQVRGLVRKTAGPSAGEDSSERVVLEDLGLQFMEFLSGG